MKIKGAEKEIIRSKSYELDGIRCDICGKIIPAPKSYIEQLDDKYKYYIITTGHHDWGNDSHESIKCRDVCPDCVMKFVQEYLQNKNAYRSAYIEVETEHIHFGEFFYEGD